MREHPEKYCWNRTIRIREKPQPDRQVCRGIRRPAPGLSGQMPETGEPADSRCCRRAVTVKKRWMVLKAGRRTLRQNGRGVYDKQRPPRWDILHTIADLVKIYLLHREKRSFQATRKHVAGLKKEIFLSRRQRVERFFMLDLKAN